MDKQTGRCSTSPAALPRRRAWRASGPSGNPTHQPNFLAMGVTSPIVDYVLATRFRGKDGLGPDMNALSQFLTEFGYTEATCRTAESSWRFDDFRSLL